MFLKNFFNILNFDHKLYQNIYFQVRKAYGYDESTEMVNRTLNGHSGQTSGETKSAYNVSV